MELFFLIPEENDASLGKIMPLIFCPGRYAQDLSYHFTLTVSFWSIMNLILSLVSLPFQALSLCSFPTHLWKDNLFFLVSNVAIDNSEFNLILVPLLVCYLFFWDDFRILSFMLLMFTIKYLV
jgi:hypothetical protein